MSKKDLESEIINKGPIINGDQLVRLINNVLSNVLVNVDTETMSKHVLLQKFKKIQQSLDIMAERTQERVYDFKSDGTITFDVGDHMYKYLTLDLCIVFIHKSNQNLNKEMTISVPRSFFIHHMPDGPAIDPYITSLSPSATFTEVSYMSGRYTNMETGQPVSLLQLILPAGERDLYESVKVAVSSLASGFKAVDMDNYNLIQQYNNKRPIAKFINIGINNYIEDDGTVVRSDIVRNINITSRDVMDQIMEANHYNPGDLNLVPIDNDESDRLLILKFDIKKPNTFISLSKKEQSKSYLVNWGDGAQDTRKNHKFRSTGTFVVKIYNRIDDLYIQSSDPKVELTAIEIPIGFRAPTEWNDSTLIYPFNGDRLLCTAPNFPGGLFKYGHKIKVIEGLIKSNTITSVSVKALEGLVNVTDLYLGDLYKHTISIESKSFEDLVSVKSFKEPFKGSALSTIPTGLLDPMESLEDITGFADRSNLKSLPDSFLNINENIKVLDSAFSNISTLTMDVTKALESILYNKNQLRSMKSIFENTPVTINIDSTLVDRFANTPELMNLSKAFKNTKVHNTVAFTLSEKHNLLDITSMLEGASTFTVKGPLLERCSNKEGINIEVGSCLKGVTQKDPSITSDANVFVETKTNGSSGLF